MTTKLASEVQVGDVIVTRPNPDALTIDYLPTVYRRVEAIEAHDLRRDPGTAYSFLYYPPRSMGHWRFYDADDKVEVTEEVDRSCSINPNGLVL